MHKTISKTMKKTQGVINQIIKSESEAINNIPVNDSFDKAVELLYTHVHEQNNKVVLSGMGKAGQVAHNIATTLSSTGTPSVFLHPSEAQHGDLGIIKPGDVLFFISNSGKTREIIELVALARNLHHNTPLIVLTGNPESELGHLADITISTGNPEEVCPLGLTPTTSITSMTVIGDILVVLMMQRIKFTREDYSRRHHGGYLGHKSRTVGAIEKIFNSNENNIER